MTWLYENPLPILFGGLALAVVLWLALASQNRRMAAICAGLTLLVMGVMLLIERRVVTDVEKVRIRIDVIARDLATNDVKIIQTHIAPDAEDIKRQARASMGLVDIDKVVIATKAKVDINPLTSPPSAIAKFVVKIEGQARGGFSGPFVRTLEVKFKRHDDKWLVSGYQLSQ